MNPTPSNRNAFTLVEVMVAMATAFVVIASAIHIHLWAGRLAKSCEEKGWSQSRALVTSSRIMACVQNASAIAAIDEVDGNWVTLIYPGGGEATLAYTNSPTTQTGALVYVAEGENPVWIAREGIENYMKSAEPAQPVFTRVGSLTNLVPNAIQIQYMVSKPTPGGESAPDTKDALNISLTSCLRNYVAP